MRIAANTKYKKTVRLNFSVSLRMPSQLLELCGIVIGVNLQHVRIFFVWSKVVLTEFSTLIIIISSLFTALDNREGNITISGSSKKRKFPLYHVTSEIHLQPSVEDDGVNYTCEAKHEALTGKRMRATVQLSVLCKYWLYLECRIYY